MAATSLTWKDLGILKDALAEFERTLEDLGIEAGEVSKQIKHNSTTHENMKKWK